MKRRTVHDLLAESRSSLTRLDARRAYDAMQKGAVLIDTRSAEERAEHGSIPGSLLIQLNVLEWRVDPESGRQDPAIGDFDDPIILICAEGYASSFAAHRLQQIGFAQATDVIGGFEAWRDAGLPITKPSQAKR